MNKEIDFALNYALKRGVQFHPNALKILEKYTRDEIERIIKDLAREKSKQKAHLINQDDLESFLGIKSEEDVKVEYKVLSDPTPYITSGEGVEGFRTLFENRFAKMHKIISVRPEAKKLKSISSVMSRNKKVENDKKNEDDIFVCGLVSSKSSERTITKLKIEDQTGVIEGLVFDEELRKDADKLLNDQFVMLKIIPSKKGGYIIKDITVPDISASPKNRSKTDAFVLFMSDLHIGSDYFLEDEFEELVEWLSSPDPVARKIHFIVIGGDLVDGVGIFPDQDKQLTHKTIEEQLQKADELLSKIPSHIKIFIMPGNHDPGRRALPQPAIPKKYFAGLWERENVTMLGNPAMISLNGVKICTFHGQSIDDIVKTTPGLSYGKPDDVMTHLLRARHLSPIFGSQTPIAPEKEDMMVIDEVPDIFHVGHVHVLALAKYRGVLLINAGTFQAKTPYQESVGATPTPGVAIMVNLKTFEIKQKNFY